MQHVLAGCSQKSQNSQCLCMSSNPLIYDIHLSFSLGFEPDRRMLNEYVKKEVINGRSVSVCTMCGKSNASRPNIVNHIESVHFPNTFTYTCKYCGKTFNAKNSLYVHISTGHRGEKS